MVNITEIKGMAAAHAARLAAAGMHTTGQLLEAAATATGRLHVADETGINPDELEGYVHQADLFRIKDITAEHVHLLYDAGVYTVPKLAYRRAAMLHEAMMAEAHRRCPTVDELEAYIKHAKQLAKIVQH